MDKHFCPICGNRLLDEFATGDICSCCGNESGFDDDILSEELVKFSDEDFTAAKLKKSELEKYPLMPLDIAYHLLRAKWIVQGCKWKYNMRNEKPDSWGIEEAEKQLKNIDVNINNYM